MTPKQAEALNAIAAGKVHCVNTGYAAYRIHGGNPSVVGRLVSLGLARWPRGCALPGDVCAITDTGRAALASLT